MTATAPQPAKFRYSAETLDGEMVKGEIVAASANAARNELAVRGMRVTKIAERKGLQVELTKEKIPLIEIMHFSRQMGTFIRSGVPVLEALSILAQDAKNKRMQSVLTDVIDRVGAGSTVADAIARHGEVFPPYFLSMLRSAEYTGRMDDAFEQLYRYIKRDVELNRQVRKALIYPMILMVVAIGVSLLIVIFVIPKFAEFFADFDAELPLPTRMLIAVSDFVQSTYGLVTGVLLIALGVGLAAYIRTTAGRRNLHALLLRLPMVGTVIVYSSTERFCRVFATLLESGVVMGDALPSAIDCSNNMVFKERLNIAAEGVLAGAGFAEPMRQTELFPSTVVQMIKVGERSGELSEQLGNVALFYEEELTYAVDKLTQWFEPMVLLFIGVVVGFVALAMVSAMYGLFNQVEI